MKRFIYWLSTLSLGFTLLVFGGLVALGFLSEARAAAPNRAVRGEQIAPEHVKYLRGTGLLEEEESVLWFYSDQPDDPEFDGNFFTRDCVVSYWVDDTNQNQRHRASFPDIAEIEVDFADAFGEKTLIHVLTHDESFFELWVNTHQGRDRTFVKEMLELWHAARRPVELPPVRPRHASEL